MNFNVTSPCGDCPFRSDTPISLRPGRMAGILNDVLRNNKTFACHKTTHGSRRKYSHCAGALVMHEKSGKPNWLIRFAHGLWLYDPSKLNMKAPVGLEADCLAAHKKIDC